ncbi:hypothetical protein [Streptomyces sp. NPDC008121]|uniref:hypothetical protein n=1 Tax=Streptomyces sp. NPDC008121 TaxID=3364809 RepID=UPI0036E7D4E3
MNAVVKVIALAAVAAAALTASPAVAAQAEPAALTQIVEFTGTSPYHFYAKAEAERQMSEHGGCTQLSVEQTHEVMGSWSYTITAECV